MSALTEADHEEITDTLLAARARIEYLTVCGSAVQAENESLRSHIAELEQEARLMRARMNRLEQDSLRIRKHTITECIDRVERGFGKDCAAATTLRHHFGVQQ